MALAGKVLLGIVGLAVAAVVLYLAFWVLVALVFGAAALAAFGMFMNDL